MTLDNKDNTMPLGLRRPKETPFNQQTLVSWAPLITLNMVITLFWIIGFIFLPVGIVLYKDNQNIHEYKQVYDSYDPSAMNVNCSISKSNAGEICNINYLFDKDVKGPFYVFYELSNFYQNHRRYVKSRSSNQLLGANLAYEDLELDCFPLIQNGSLLLNPCGLIANSLFNDVIELTSGPPGIVMDTEGIAWESDLDVKFQQVDGFTYSQVNDLSQNCTQVLGSGYDDCKVYTDNTNVTYYYWYPDDNNVQYLYESFPSIINPIEGVKNEHFVVWMRTAGLPYFRKTYGKIDTDISAGQTLSFQINTNFEVASFSGSKALVVTTLESYGATNDALGIAFITIGCISLFVGIFLAIKRTVDPRPLGDIRVLKWTHTI
jgi:hypothetical protein